MRVVTGKHVRHMDRAELSAWAETYRAITIDLGAGDGRFVAGLARREPELGAIAVDLCAANLRGASRAAAGNALFVVADALALPEALSGMANRVTINFPWGSLLRGLLAGHPGLMEGLMTVSSGRSTLEIVVNAGALAEEGWTLGEGEEQIRAVLCDISFHIDVTRTLGPSELRQWPTTWAKRLAFGRDPHALHISTILPPSQTSASVLRPPSPVPPLCYTPRLAGELSDCQYVSLSAP